MSVIFKFSTSKGIKTLKLSGFIEMYFLRCLVKLIARRRSSRSFDSMDVEIEANSPSYTISSAMPNMVSSAIKEVKIVQAAAGASSISSIFIICIRSLLN